MTDTKGSIEEDTSNSTGASPSGLSVWQVVGVIVAVLVLSAGV